MNKMNQIYNQKKNHIFSNTTFHKFKKLNENIPLIESNLLLEDEDQFYDNIFNKEKANVGNKKINGRELIERFLTNNEEKRKELIMRKRNEILLKKNDEILEKNLKKKLYLGELTYFNLHENDRSLEIKRNNYRLFEYLKKSRNFVEVKPFEFKKKLIKLNTYNNKLNDLENQTQTFRNYNVHLNTISSERNKKQQGNGNNMNMTLNKFLNQTHNYNFSQAHNKNKISINKNIKIPQNLNKTLRSFHHSSIISNKFSKASPNPNSNDNNINTTLIDPSLKSNLFITEPIADITEYSNQSTRKNIVNKISLKKVNLKMKNEPSNIKLKLINSHMHTHTNPSLYIHQKNARTNTNSSLNSLYPTTKSIDYSNKTKFNSNINQKLIDLDKNSSKISNQLIDIIEQNKITKDEDKENEYEHDCNVILNKNEGDINRELLSKNNNFKNEIKKISQNFKEGKILQNDFVVTNNYLHTLTKKMCDKELLNFMDNIMMFNSLDDEEFQTEEQIKFNKLKKQRELNERMKNIKRNDNQLLRATQIFNSLQQKNVKLGNILKKYNEKK